MTAVEELEQGQAYDSNGTNTEIKIVIRSICVVDEGRLLNIFDTRRNQPGPSVTKKELTRSFPFALGKGVTESG